MSLILKIVTPIISFHFIDEDTMKFTNRGEAKGQVQNNLLLAKIDHHDHDILCIDDMRVGNLHDDRL
jgi:hypothetical protein